MNMSKRYYKTVVDGIITSIGIGEHMGEEITADEYNHILGIVQSMPIAPDGYEYRLSTELDLELYAVPITEEEKLRLEEEWAKSKKVVE